MTLRTTLCSARYKASCMMERQRSACPPVCCAGRAHTGRNGNSSSRRTVTSRSKAKNISGVSDTGKRIGFTRRVETKPDDGLLRGALLLNHAACNRELWNCGTVLRDCTTAIATNTHAPSRGYDRVGLAPLLLELLYEALDMCARVGDGR
ncbi:hypothetical protein BJV78DRAFT_239643 [Lactifluus subvellereus]|nr:hypothetical protein BJV78DRAFT_239643 [Lactifluus subvellereus]